MDHHNEFMVQPLVSDFPPSGPDPWYRPRSLLEEVAEGPADAEFARWWRLNGQNMPGYVARCRLFVRDRLATGVSRLLDELHRPSFDGDLACLIHDIGVWMHENSRVTFGLERLHDAPAFTREERREFKAEMALYRRADSGRRLVQAHYDRLRTTQLNDDPRLIAPRLAALLRALERWLADAPGGS
jgi:hypothetical protein